MSTTAPDPMNAIGYPITPDGIEAAAALMADAWFSPARGQYEQGMGLENARLLAEYVGQRFSADAPDEAWRSLRSYLLPDETLVQQVAATLLAHADTSVPARIRTRPAHGVGGPWA